MLTVLSETSWIEVRLNFFLFVGGKEALAALDKAEVDTEHEDYVSEPEIDQEELNQLLADSQLPLDEVVAKIAKVVQDPAVADPLEAEFAKLTIVAPEADIPTETSAI